jgi:probable F420-dependent oxidoreductase
MQPTNETSHAAALGLGRIGLWSASVRYSPADVAAEAAAEIEALGFPTLWIPGGHDREGLAVLDRLLAATSRIKIATGIVSIWTQEPADIAAWWRRLAPERRERVLLGLGVSHGRVVGEAYERESPLAKMRAFLDGLDAAGMPKDRLCLAALGPRMLTLAAERTAGAHPYLTSPRHTAAARQTLGAGPLLAPEQGIILEQDPERARAIARETVKLYAALPNYFNSWRREGFADADITGLSDGFVDAVMAWGGLEAAAARVDAHVAAGADHVCLQVITGGLGRDVALERPGWRELACLL